MSNRIAVLVFALAILIIISIVWSYSDSILAFDSRSNRIKLLQSQLPQTHIIGKYEGIHASNSSESISHIESTRKSLSISIGVASNPIDVGDTQTVLITVSDANTSSTVPQAHIDSVIVVPSERETLSQLSPSHNLSSIHFVASNKLSGIADDLGNFVFTSKIGRHSELGIYSVAAYVYAAGYEPKLSIKTFNVRAR